MAVKSLNRAGEVEVDIANGGRRKGNHLKKSKQTFKGQKEQRLLEMNKVLRKDRSGSVIFLGDLKDHLQDNIRVIPQTRITSQLDDDKDGEKDCNEKILEEGVESHTDGSSEEAEAMRRELKRKAYQLKLDHLRQGLHPVVVELAMKAEKDWTIWWQLLELFKAINGAGEDLRFLWRYGYGQWWMEMSWHSQGTAAVHTSLFAGGNLGVFVAGAERTGGVAGPGDAAGTGSGIGTGPVARVGPGVQTRDGAGAGLEVEQVLEEGMKQKPEEEMRPCCWDEQGRLGAGTQVNGRLVEPYLLCPFLGGLEESDPGRWTNSFWGKVEREKGGRGRKTTHPHTWPSSSNID
ncbi:hypothetical protein PPACK8108_LOCUS14672 [Phakopsora pachyrhizi]|uniref:Uncharacterized protein n=1 Tax=Phakopsora pachyrhizi TaxID=170000 RepID=A0AAV0B4W4_PHAPC|nr:hypothetical protein PPACK8108_LOCUS14672 [Phakopsora pachyrhizi]